MRARNSTRRAITGAEFQPRRMSHSGTIATIERSEDNYRRYYNHETKCVHHPQHQRWFTGSDEPELEFDYVQLNTEVWNTEPPPIAPRDMFADNRNYSTSTPIARSRAASVKSFDSSATFQQGRFTQRVVPTESMRGSNQMQPMPGSNKASFNASPGHQQAYRPRASSTHSGQSRLNTSGSTQRSSDLSTSNIVPPYAQQRDDPFANLPKPATTSASSKPALFVPASTASRPAPPVLPDPPEPTPSERSVSPARSTVSGSSDAFSLFSMGCMYMPSENGHRRKSKDKAANTEKKAPVKVQQDDVLQQYRENSQRFIEERDAAKKAELEIEKAKQEERAREAEAKKTEKERKAAELQRAAAKKAETLKRAHKEFENAERLKEQREREQQVAQKQEQLRIYQKALDDTKLAAERQKALDDARIAAEREKALDDARIVAKLEQKRAAKEREEAQAAAMAAQQAEKHRQEAEQAEKQRQEAEKQRHEAEEAQKKQLEADAAAKELEKQNQEPPEGATGFVNCLDYNSDQNLSGADSWDFNFNGTFDTDTDSFDPSAPKSSTENTVDSNHSEPLPTYSATGAQLVDNGEILVPQRPADINLPQNGASNNFGVTSRNRETETDVNATLKSRGISGVEKRVPNAEVVDAAKHQNADDASEIAPETDGESFMSDSDEDVVGKPSDGPHIPFPEKPDDMVEEVRRKLAEMSMAYQQIPEKRSDNASPRDFKIKESPKKVPDTTQGTSSPEVDTILKEVRQRIEEVNESQNNDSEDDSALEKPDETEAVSQLQASRTPQRVSEVLSSNASQYHSPLSSPMVSATPTHVSAEAVTTPSSPHLFETLPPIDAEDLSTYRLIVARELLSAPGFVDTLEKVSPVGVIFGHYYLVINGSGIPSRGQVYDYEPATKKYRVFLNDENVFCAVKIDALRQMPAEIATALGHPAVLYHKFKVCPCGTCTSMLTQPL
uniref:Reticulocyte-binding protein 2-like protein a n=1 Tax=Panagrellus redivivus TaxID=6233 RepID=A0A7E4VGC5_PANRE